MFLLTEPFAALLPFPFSLFPFFIPDAVILRAWGFMVMGLKKPESIAGKMLLVIISKRMI